MQVKFWHKEFRGGRDAVQNASHQRRPRTSTTPENFAAVRDLIEGDRRLTVVEICQELGISYGSVQSIIKNELQFQNISARWVPRLLSAASRQCQTPFRSPNRRKIDSVVLDCPRTLTVQPGPLPLRLPHIWTPQGGDRGVAFRRWWAGREFCAQLATDVSSFILQRRIKKLPIRWQKCIEKDGNYDGNYVDQWQFFYFVKLCFNKKNWKLRSVYIWSTLVYIYIYISLRSSHYTQHCIWDVPSLNLSLCLLL